MTSKIRTITREAFKRWVAIQNHEATLASESLRVWLVVDLAVLVVLLTINYMPAAQEWFALKLFPASLCYLPARAGVVFFWLIHDRSVKIRNSGWIIILFICASLEFFTAMLVVYSTTPGSILFAAFFLFVTVYHGYFLKTTVREPFVVIGSIIAVILAAYFSSSTQHLAIFAVVGPIAISSSLIVGSLAVRAEEARNEAEAARLREETTQLRIQAEREHAEAEAARLREEALRLREAVQAQQLAHAQEQLGRLSNTIVEILAYHHDMNNSLAVAESVKDAFVWMTENQKLPTHEELAEFAGDLHSSIGHMRVLVANARDQGRTSASRLEPVDGLPLFESVCVQMKKRFPHIEIIPSMGSLSSQVLVAGGETTLRRIAENLVINACEGNGQHTASRVEFIAHSDVTGARLDWKIRDNGPGFPPELLERPIQSLRTTKAQGTGLGLYTSEQLIRASGGTLTRRNATEGGAIIQIFLPLADEYQRAVGIQ